MNEEDVVQRLSDDYSDIKVKYENLKTKFNNEKKENKKLRREILELKMSLTTERELTTKLLYPSLTTDI